MHIEIAERLKPFFHAPGIFFILPGTSYRFQIFPTCIKVEDLSDVSPTLIFQLNMDVQGPLDQFTVEQDLEKGVIRVWEMLPTGLFRFHLKTLTEKPGVGMTIEKAPKEGIPFQCTGIWSSKNSQPLQAGQHRLFSPCVDDDKNDLEYKIPLIDRLSLGNHKSQDWELMRRRRNFAEIFPIWHRLGQLVPNQAGNSQAGTLSLFENCQAAITANSPEHILAQFEKIFLAGFDLGLSPRLIDTDFQGILPNVDIAAIEKVSPLQLLTQGAELIRSLFIQCHKDSIVLLPTCPPSFHCGRLINVDCSGLGILSMEWTKKAMRCMSFMAASSQTIAISARDGQIRCRIRQSSKDPGSPYELGSAINVIAGQHYWFDNFVS
ncbi:MAG: hypothetical protein H0X29_01050 [Parachlamydiaceae bacterium]|nr:hypothetical protein [Parachlamydiaceae bacterium]